MRKWTMILAVSALVLTAAGCAKLQSRNEINTGVASFKNAQYPEAVEHFKKAVEYDPSFVTARLYLATAYMQQWIPGADSPENAQMAKAAMDQFQKVLEQQPKNSNAVASIASIYLNDKKLDDAQQWYEKLAAVDPNNPTAYYSLGWIAWSKWYPADQKARVEMGMKLEEPGPLKDKKVREELKGKYEPVINDGLKNLDKALQIDPNYVDAMAYENLLFRERADLADNKGDYEKDVKTADGWMQKTLDTKKMLDAKKAEAAAKGGIVQETK
ncbi:MAG TPA: tetratricopeptide repeat protein [Bryobacteraceae bacterium]|nr:tetratricopeptide repeat protein [Bryobacteraceae bacterium]